MSSMNQKHIQVCLEAGFRKVFFDKDGDLIAMFPGNGDEHDDEMIVRKIEGGFKAWILTGPFGRKSPKSITESWSGGNRPVYTFKTVREAAQMAKGGRYY